MAAVETRQAALRAQIVEILRHGITRAAERRGIVDGLGESVLQIEGNSAPKAAIQPRLSGVINRIADGSVVNEAHRVADRQALFRGERRAGRRLVGHLLNVEARALGAE